jgi:hypothetical protein
MALLPLPDQTTAYVMPERTPTRDFYNWLRSNEQTLKGIINGGVPGLGGRSKIGGDLTVFVDPTSGSDSNDGSSGSPWQTLLHAGYQLVNNYDLAGSMGIIKLAQGTHDWSALPDAGFFPGWNLVGGYTLPSIRIDGWDVTDPSQTVIVNSPIEFIDMPPGSNCSIGISGITLQNFSNRMFNFQSGASTLWFGNLRLVDCSSDITIDCEGGGSVICSGLPWSAGQQKISVGGSHAQLMYVNKCGVDWNDTILDFEVGTTFSYAVFNVAKAGILNYHDNANQGFGVNPTGKAFYISTGACINADDITQSFFIDYTTMPGTILGVNNCGYFNEVSEECWPFTVATLPTPGTGNNTRAMVTDANATTFHSVVAGGGANIVPVYWDSGSSNWRIG